MEVYRLKTYFFLFEPDPLGSKGRVCQGCQPLPPQALVPFLLKKVNIMYDSYEKEEECS